MPDVLKDMFDDMLEGEPPLGLTSTGVASQGRRIRARRRWTVATAAVAVLGTFTVGGVGYAASRDPGPPPVASDVAGQPAPSSSEPTAAVASPPPGVTSESSGQPRRTTPSTSARRPSPSSSPSTAARNQLTDPSFEAVPSPWVTFGKATTLAPSTTARTGARSIAVTTTAENVTAGIISRPVNVITEAGRTYRASCWVRSDVKVDAYMQVQEYAMNWDRMGDPFKAPKALLRDAARWYPMSLTYVAKQSGNQLPLVVFGTGLAPGSGQMLVDDCTLTAN